MTNSFLNFLGHGGFKLLIIAFFLVAQFLKARAKESKKRDAEVRGSTAISDFSNPTPLPEAKSTSKSTSGSPSGSASPWSNLDAFDSRKP